MSDRKTVTLDPVIIEDDRFISDQKIRQLVRDSVISSNPNPAKYSEVQLKFEPQKKLNYAAAKETIQAFEYDSKFEGKFKANRYYGPLLVKSESSVYVGQMIGDKREGRGLLIFLDGNMYEGYFENDCTAIRGRLLFDNGDVYMGGIANMSMNGQGVYYNNTAGSKFTGNFKDDAPHGQGIEEWKDGMRYEGSFVMGQKEGKGIFKTKEGSVYEGELKKGAFDGQGTLTTLNKTKYIGKWKASELQSPAEIVYEDGKKYIGEVGKDMKPHGKGTIESSKKKYVGSFKNGSLDGQVTTIFPGGETKTSLYQAGKFVQWVGGNGLDTGKQEDLELYTPLSGRKPEKKVVKETNKPLNQSQGGQLPMDSLTMVNPGAPEISSDPTSTKPKSPDSNNPTNPPTKKKLFCC